MLRWISILLLPAVLLLTSPTPSQAQYYQSGYPAWQGVTADYLAGTYRSTSNGVLCYVYRRGHGFTFVNDHGSSAHFVFNGPNQLVQVAGQWDPTVVCTVTRDRLGRIVLAFTSPNAAPGYWVKVA